MIRPMCRPIPHRISARSRAYEQSATPRFVDSDQRLSAACREALSVRPRHRLGKRRTGERVSMWQIELESHVEAELQALVGRAMDAPSDGDHESDPTCELLPRADVDD